MNEELKKNYIEDICKLISIDSVCNRGESEDCPYGKGVKDSLSFTLDLCRKFGFKVKECGNNTAWAEIGEGSPLIGILAHLDVVPIGEGWSYKQGEVADGKVYGRGVIDDKGPVISAIYAMKKIKDEGNFNGRVRLILGQCEETGVWTDMQYYVKNEELPDFGYTPDADFPIIYAEKGITQVKFIADAPECLVSLNGGTAANVVPSSASIEIKAVDGSVISLSAVGKPAHASTPHLGINAISLLMADVDKLNKEGKIDFAFADFYSRCVGLRTDAEGFGYTYSDEVGGPLTLNIGKIAVESGKIVVTADCRYPVTGNLEDVMKHFTEASAEFGVSVEKLMHLAPVYKPKDSQLITSLLEAYREVTGDYTSEPQAIGGGTYARAMPNVVAFGPALPGIPATVHQANEAETIDQLIKNVEINYLAIKKLSQIK